MEPTSPAKSRKPRSPKAQKSAPLSNTRNLAQRIADGIVAFAELMTPLAQAMSVLPQLGQRPLQAPAMPPPSAPKYKTPGRKRFGQSQEPAQTSPKKRARAKNAAASEKKTLYWAERRRAEGRPAKPGDAELIAKYNQPAPSNSAHAAAPN